MRDEELHNLHSHEIRTRCVKVEMVLTTSRGEVKTLLSVVPNAVVSALVCSMALGFSPPRCSIKSASNHINSKNWTRLALRLLQPSTEPVFAICLIEMSHPSHDSLLCEGINLGA